MNRLKPFPIPNRDSLHKSIPPGHHSTAIVRLPFLHVEQVVPLASTDCASKVCKIPLVIVQATRGNRLSAVRIALPQEKASNRRSKRWTAGLLLFAMALPAPISAKTPGGQHCYKGICHRVKTISETRALIGKTLRLKASHYGHCRSDRYNPCRLTSSGEKFRADAPDNAASPDLPNGTILLIYYPATGRAAVVRVNNAGPYWHGRRLDVSQATAQVLGFARKGIAKLHVRVLRAPIESEARYRNGRRYRRVPGYIGRFASLDAAEKAVRFIASFAARSRLAQVDFADFDELALEAIPVRNVERDEPFATNAPARLSARKLEAARPSFEWLNEAQPSGVVRLAATASGVRLNEMRRLAQVAPSANARSLAAARSAERASLTRSRQLPGHVPEVVVSPLRFAALNRELLPRAMQQESRADPRQLTPLSAIRTVTARSDEDSLYRRIIQFAQAARAAARRTMFRPRAATTKPPPREQSVGWWKRASWNWSFKSVFMALADAANEASRRARASVSRYPARLPTLPSEKAAQRDPHQGIPARPAHQASRPEYATQFSP